MDLMQSLIASRLLGDGGGGGSATLITKSVTQNGTYSATDDQADGYFEVSVDVQPSLDTKTITTNGTYPASSENLDGYSSVTVNVPDIPAVIQSLSISENGTYTAPSGVDGYNDINVEVPDIPPVLDDITITENGNYTPPSGTDGYNDINVNVPQPTLSKLTVTQNGTQTAPSGTAWNKVVTNVPAPSNAIYKQTLSNLPSPIATFTGADAPIDSLKASIVGVQSGSGDPSPSNVRPISGWTSCVVNRTGKNLVEGTISGMNVSTTGVINSGSNYDLNIAKVAQGMTYTFTTDDSAKVYAFFTAKPTSGSTSYNNIRYVGNDTFTAPIDGYVAFRTNANYAYAQCELGDQATTYESYNGNTYTIQFKDSSDNPLTVYYGNIDICNGKLIVTHIGEFYDGSFDEGWEKRGKPNQYFRITVADAGTYVDGSIKCNQFEYANITNNNTNIGITVAPAGNNQVIGARPSNYLDLSLEDWKTQLATNPLQVIYELVTPLEYDLTPIAIRSNGVTNISVNCGEVTECKYYSDDILYNANNLQIANTSTYITANLNAALEVGKTYVGIIKDYGNWSNVPIIFTRFSGNQSITVSLAQGSGTLVFTNNTVTLDPYAGDYRNIYLTLREYII